jgi:hypothetical protein
MDECGAECRACAESYEKMASAVKRRNLICRTFRRANAEIDSAGRAGRIGQVYIALGACFSDRQLLASQLPAQETCIFWPTRELVVGGSRKFFERGFPQFSVKLFTS